MTNTTDAALRRDLADALGRPVGSTWPHLLATARDQQHRDARLTAYLTAAQTACDAPTWAHLPDCIHALRTSHATHTAAALHTAADHATPTHSPAAAWLRHLATDTTPDHQPLPDTAPTADRLHATYHRHGYPTHLAHCTTHLLLARHTHELARQLRDAGHPAAADHLTQHADHLTRRALGPPHP